MRRSRLTVLMGVSLSALALLAGACTNEPAPTATPRSPTPTPQATPVATTTATTPTPAASPSATAEPTATPQPTATATPVPGTAVKATAHPELGTVLTDTEGNVLYLFTNDERDTSNCYGGCATAWPPLLTQGAPVAEGEGVAADRLGTTARTDGTTQVTYNGWPLYYFVQDEAPGDANGQARNSVWFVVSTYGGPIETTAIVSTREHAELGAYLTDQSGRALYLFTRDEPNTTNCSGDCALNWPPVLTTDGPLATEDAATNLLGTIERADGSMQVTYNGWPLYYWWRDTKPGDITGQNVGNVWYLVNPNGEAITALPTPPVTPTPEATGTPSAAATVNSSITGFTLESITVATGTTITWTNNHSAPHTVTATGTFDSGTMTNGATFSHTFDTAGTYPYFCEFHSGMAGTITVV